MAAFCGRFSVVSEFTKLLQKSFVFNAPTVHPTYRCG